MSELTDSGFVRDRYQDERDQLAERWQSYLPGRRTDSQSVNGRIISIQADLVDSTNAKIEMLLSAFSPYSARGNLLSRLAPLMSKSRREAVISSVRLTVTATAAGVTIPAGSIVGQASGASRFATIADVTVAPSGSAFVSAFATEAGAIEAAAGTLTEIQTPVFGWASVTNAGDASVGRSRETDAQLRFRMLRTSAAAVGTPEGIQAALGELDGVTYARVLENDGDTVNASGMPPHSIFPIVDGGSDEEIALSLLATVASGIQYTTSADIAEPDWTSVVVQNPANLQDETIWFARPSDTSGAVAMTIETDSEFPSDGLARIKAAVIAFADSWDIGKTLYASRLYSPVNTVPGIDINGLTIDATDRIELEAYERIKLTESDITITVV